MKYRIEATIDGELCFQEWRATSYMEFKTHLFHCRYDFTDIDYTVLIDGKKVTYDEAFEHINDMREAALAKKQKTHKLIWVHHGATNLPQTWHQVWVKQ